MKILGKHKFSKKSKLCLHTTTRMGKNTRITRKKKRRATAAARRRKAAKDDLENLSVEELLAAAQEEMDSFQYEAAQTLCRTALQKDPDNVAVLETSASLCLEVGNLDGARHCLGRAITLQPESGLEKYMSMAQLMEGQEALQCYQKGIEILTRKMSNLPAVKKTEEDNVEVVVKSQGEALEMATEDEGGKSGTPKGRDEAKEAMGQDKAGAFMLDEGNENVSPAEASAGGSRLILGPQEEERTGLARQVSTAHCSVAELFMTDLCDEEEAEETCRANIMRAIEVDPTNPEAYQHMVSLFCLCCVYSCLLSWFSCPLS